MAVGEAGGGEPVIYCPAEGFHFVWLDLIKPSFGPASNDSIVIGGTLRWDYIIIPYKLRRFCTDNGRRFTDAFAGINGTARKIFARWKLSEVQLCERIHAGTWETFAADYLIFARTLFRTRQQTNSEGCLIGGSIWNFNNDEIETIKRTNLKR